MKTFLVVAAIAVAVLSSYLLSAYVMAYVNGSELRGLAAHILKR